MHSSNVILSPAKIKWENVKYTCMAMHKHRNPNPSQIWGGAAKMYTLSEDTQIQRIYARLHKKESNKQLQVRSNAKTTYFYFWFRKLGQYCIPVYVDSQKYVKNFITYKHDGNRIK